jgi:hypothetical protein
LFFRELVVPFEFVLYPEEDEGRAGDADGEADYIEEGIGPIFPEVSEIGFQVVGEHVDVVLVGWLL